MQFCVALASCQWVVAFHHHMHWQDAGATPLFKNCLDTPRQFCESPAHFSGEHVDSPPSPSRLFFQYISLHESRSPSGESCEIPVGTRCIRLRTSCYAGRLAVLVSVRIVRHSGGGASVVPVANQTAYKSPTVIAKMGYGTKKLMTNTKNLLTFNKSGNQNTMTAGYSMAPSTKSRASSTSSSIPNRPRRRRPSKNGCLWSRFIRSPTDRRQTDAAQTDDIPASNV